MKKKFLISAIVAVLAVGGVSFYGGMKYGEGKTSPGNFQNMSAEQRQQMFQQVAGTNGGQARAFRGGTDGTAGANFGGARPVSGEIISQSDGNITIKLADGSTRIVFIGDSTKITKSTEGAPDDLKAGEEVFVSGTQNPDGSYTANTIQLSPAGN